MLYAFFIFMKALVLTQANTVEIIEKATPVPAAGEVLVRLKAAALNHRDQWIREGRYPGIEQGVTLGSDGAGIVERAGDPALTDWIGKEVIINPNRNWGPNPAVQSPEYNILGMPQNGTFAEYIAIPVDRLQPKPAYMNWAEAASIPLGGLTAYRALFTHGKVQQGMQVLINGIGGGVAQWAFLFAQGAGAGVWATSSSEDKLAAVVARGARGGFNYREESWAKKAKKETGGIDLIIDSAGGNSLNDLLDVVKPGGSIVFYGATTGVPENLNLRKVFWNQIRLQGSTMGNDQEFKEMIAFIEQQQLRPIMEEPIRFDNIIEAFDRMKNGEQFGKLVILME